MMSPERGSFGSAARTPEDAAWSAAGRSTLCQRVRTLRRAWKFVGASRRSIPSYWRGTEGDYGLPGAAKNTGGGALAF
jgi:hypothetical protein